MAYSKHAEIHCFYSVLANAHMIPQVEQSTLQSETSNESTNGINTTVKINFDVSLFHSNPIKFNNLDTSTTLEPPGRGSTYKNIREFSRAATESMV